MQPYCEILLPQIKMRLAVMSDGRQREMYFICPPWVVLDDEVQEQEEEEVLRSPGDMTT